ncbi:MFS transporter [Actinomadura rayongensis]|uniref:MFS transporter n=1 Tax=Actinomadura rayongensis TaxID=1429076 RepID=A0A6I4WAH2_9ACTN|nr:MFS transporter [Actinomadura rayongensis]MXQ66648.1 MFS transporter [Actinomadura rayongensis]
MPNSALATPRGRLLLALLCLVAFLDFVDASIVNVALPEMREDLGFSVPALQWVPSGYLLTYGGLMLLGGRAADLLGRRPVLLLGTALFALASLAGGLAPTAGVLVAARLGQGVGAALMLPAALSILTTTFRHGTDRARALGAWGAMAGLGSAAGVLFGGLLTEGPGWRWVMFVNLPAAAVVLFGTVRLVAPDGRRARLLTFDLPGALLSTAGMLLLVFTLVKAPDVGWGSVRTVAGLAGALLVLAAFVLVEGRGAHALLPLSLLRIRGLVAANVTQLIGLAGFLAVFFFLTLYMQNILGYSPIRTGLAYLPVTVGVGVAAGATPRLVTRIGARPVIVAGALLAAVGVGLLSRVPVDGSYAVDLLPGLVVMAIGLGMVFVAVTTAANAGVPAERAGAAAALLNASQQLGGALGLAVFTAVAVSRTNDLMAAHASAPVALTSGFHRALLCAAGVLVVAAVIALRTANTRHEPAQTVPEEQPTHA